MVAPTPTGLSKKNNFELPTADIGCTNFHVLRELGLTPTQAIPLFYKQVNLHNGLPFPLNIPNAETRQAIEDAQEGRGLKKFNTSEKLFDDLGI